MPPEHLEHHSIRMTIFTYDRYSRHEAIGETEMRLSDVDLFPEPFSTWLTLSDVNEVFMTCFIIWRLWDFEQNSCHLHCINPQV